MDITEISDRMELEKLVTDYATAVDTKNFQDFNNLFTKDAHIDYTAVGGIAGNLQEIIQYLETALRSFPKLSTFNFKYFSYPGWSCRFWKSDVF